MNVSVFELFRPGAGSIRFAHDGPNNGGSDDGGRLGQDGPG